MNIKYIIHFVSSHNNFWLILFEYILMHFTRIAIYIGNIKILNQLTPIKHNEGNTMPIFNIHLPAYWHLTGVIGRIKS